jgi:hypothetical protein
VNLIVDETNTYKQKANEKLISESKVGPKSRIHRFAGATDDDI